MEQVWKRPFGPEVPTLSAWQRDAAEGWRPAVAFGVTVIETGEHALFATYRTGMREVAGARDVSMVTAARLSASFPFVSPPARADLGDFDRATPAYHLIDSGVTDNSGWTAVREWLKAVQGDLTATEVMLVDIRSMSPRKATDPTDQVGWTLGLTAPLLSMLKARNARHENVSREIAEFDRWWQTGHPPLQHVMFALDDQSAPLTWNLGRADGARLRVAWERNRPNALRVCTFLTGEAKCPE